MSEANKQYQVNSNDLITVADAIRLRTGETRDLIFPDEFVVGINSIAGTWRPIHVNGTEILSTDPASGFLNLKIASGSVNILGITATSATGGQNAEFGIRVNPTYFSSDAQNGLSPANSWISTLVTNPMQAANDLIIGGTSGAPTRLAGGSVGQVLGIDSNGNIGWLSEAHTGTVTSVTLTQGTGITVSDSGVAITSSGTREISLNIASTSALGGIRVGEGLMATAAGVLSIDSTTATEGDVFIRDTDGFAWTHQYTAYNTSSIPWGKVNTTSTSTLFTATVPGVTAYRDGVSFWLKNGVVTSASGFTININGLGAKKVYSNMAPTTRDTTIFNVNYTMLFVYDAALDDGAGAFVCYRGYDANTNTIGYQIRTGGSALVAQAKFYRYRLLFTSADGTQWVPANTSTSTNATAVRAVNESPIDPFGAIVWYGTTAAVDAGAVPGTSYLWQQMYGSSTLIGYSFNRTGAAATMTAHLPIYIKCAPQSDGSAIIDADTPYVQTLPITDDGKIYIMLGRAIDATHFEILLNHPVYAHVNGHVQLWTPYAATAGSAGAATSAIYDGGLNPQQKISEWYGHSISVSGHTLTLEDANGDELNAITLPDDNTTYTLGTGPQTVTLTPSNGSVQSITVPYATSALNDDGGNQITTHYGHILITNGNTIGLEDGNGDEITGSFITVPYATAAGSAGSATSAIYDGGLNPTQKISEWYGHSLSLSNGVLTLEDANGDSLSTVTLPESVTYTLGTSGNNVTLTPSTGSVQSITVPYATKARGDDGGNQISTYYGHKLIISGNTLGLEDGNGDEISGSFVTVPYASTAGSVAWANVSGHAAGVKEDLGIATSGTTFLRKDGTWATPINTWRPIKYDTTTLNDTTTTLEFVAGSNIGLTFSAGKLTISSSYTNTTYTLGTSGNTVTLTPSSGSVQSITVPYATNARNDDGGNQISVTYGHALIVSGNTVGLEDGNGDEITGSFVTVPYATAAGSVAWTNVSGHAAGVKDDLGITTSGTTFLRKDGTWATPTDTNTTYSLSGALASHKFTTTLTATNPSGTSTSAIEFAAGSNVTLTDDTTNKKITIAATDTTYTLGTGINTVTLTPSSGSAQSITVPYATAARNDDGGNQISATYGHSLVVSGTTVGLEDGNGDELTGSFVTIPYATAAGNASTADTANSVAWANVSGHAAGVKSDLGIASSGTTFLRKDGTWVTPTDTNTTYAISGALASHKFTTTLTATNPSGTSTAAIEFVAGSNVTLTDDTTNKKITIASANTTYTLGVGTNTVTLTPSSGSAQSITVPYATNARNDDGGNQISTTYGHSLIVSGNTVGLEDGNGDEITGSFVTVPYASSAGSVAWANVDGHLAGVKADLGIESSGSTFLRKDGTWATPANTTYALSHPTNTYNLVLSAGGTAQDTITLGANAWNSTAIPTVYIKSAAVSGSTLTLTKSDNTTVTFSDTDLNTWRPVKYGSTTLNDTATTLEFVAGSNVGLSFSSGKLTISSSYTNTTYTLGTSGNTVTLTPSSGSVQSITVPYATTARGDDGGHQISTHYGHLLVISGNTIGLEDGNGDEITGSFITVPYATAANTATTADSANSVAWANVSGHAAGVKADIGIATTGTTFLRKDGQWVTPTDTNTTYAISGALSSHKFTTTLTATNPSGTSTTSLELVAGTNITLTDDTTNRKITIASANTTYTLGTNGNSVTLTPSSGSVQSITVPYATNAKNDDGGNQISTTYGHALIVSGNTVGLEDGNGDELTGSFVTVPYATAAGSVDWANVNGHAAGVKADLGIASSGATFLRKDGQWATPANTTYTLTHPTNTYNLVLNAGGTAQDTITLGANAWNSTAIPTVYIKSASVNGSTLTLTKSDDTTVTFSDTDLNTWRPIKYGSTTLNDKTTTLEFVAGSNVGLSFSSGKLTISSSYTNTTYTLGTNVNTVTLTPSSGSVQSITVPYATNARNDDGGNQISTTYGHSLTVSGNTVGLEDGNGDDISGSFITVPYATSAGSATTATNAYNLVAYSSNEVTLGNNSTTAGASTNTVVWINYRDVYGGSVSNNAAQLTQYNFANRKGAVTGVTVVAGAFQEGTTLLSDKYAAIGHTHPNMVTGSGLTSGYFVVGNNNSAVKISTMQPTTSSTTWSTTSEVNVPTMKAISNYVTGLGYTTNTGTVTSVGFSAGTGISLSGNTTINTSGTVTITNSGVVGIKIGGSSATAQTGTVIFNAFSGTDGDSAGTIGLVPAPPATSAKQFLTNQGTWGIISASDIPTLGYLPLTGGTLTPPANSGSRAPLVIDCSAMTSTAWTEGIRIKPAANGWTSIILCGTDNTATNNSSANSWSMHAYSGSFYLSRNGSTSANQQLTCASGLWTMKSDSTSTAAGTLTVTSSAANANAHVLLDLLAPSLSAGSSGSYSTAWLRLGVALNTRNSGCLGFHYVGSGSTSNYLGLGLYAVDYVLNIVGTGRVGIQNTAPISELDVTGGISWSSKATSQYNATLDVIEFTFV